MNRLKSKRFLIFILILIFSSTTFSSLAVMTSPSQPHAIPVSLPQQKKAKIKKPMSAKKAQKQANAKDKQRKKESKKYIQENRKRSIEIQTPEVQQRMKQNVKDANARYKTKNKKNASRTKKAGRKYK
jgi:hypothetical protein